MALTESRLRQIIREEAVRVMGEGDYEGREDARNPFEKERMDRASEMGGDEHEEEMGAASPALARDAAQMFIDSATQNDSFDSVAEEFWNHRLGEVDFTELEFAIKSRCEGEGWGKEFLRPSVIEDAAGIVAEKILNRKRSQRGGSGYRRRY